MGFNASGLNLALSIGVQAPYVLTSEPLLVNKGEKVLLTSSVLQIQDDDNPEDVLVVVRDPPKHGHLLHLPHDRLLQQFRLDDLIQEQLYYVHDGSDGPQDTLLLQISDGYSYQNLLVHVNVARMVWKQYNCNTQTNTHRVDKITEATSYI